MKAIRYLATCLFLFTGIMHILLAVKAPSDPYFIPRLVFGVVYFALGISLIMKKKFAVYLGIIIPIIPLVLSFFLADFKTLDTWSIILLGIDVLVIICCLLLLLIKEKVKPA